MTISGSIGTRVATCRRLRGLTQQQLADLAGGISRQYVSMIESGRRPVDKRETLYALCRALQVSVADLTGEPFEPLDQHQVQARAHIPAIELALMTIDTHPGDLAAKPQPLTALRHATDQALALRMQGHYADLTELLPRTLTDLAAHAADSSSQADRTSAQSGLVRAAFACCMGVKELGFTSLAWLAATTATTAATATADPLDLAAAAFLRSQVLLASSASGQSYVVAAEAAALLEPHLRTSAAQEIYGMLHLQAGLTASVLARQHPQAVSTRLDDAATHLRQAQNMATRTGEGRAFHLHFGPANVGVWGLSIAMEQDEPARVHDLAPTIDPSTMTAPNRLSRYYLEQGRAYARIRQTDQALAMLLRAENIAPQYVRNRPVVRELIGYLVRDTTRRAVPERLAALARRTGTTVS